MGITTELLNMKSLLERMGSFAVPPYQQQFRWQDSTSSNIVLDVYRERNRSAYRLGQIVIYRNEEGKLLVIDGYQRLVALKLIANAVSLKCGFTAEREYDRESARRIRSSYHEIKRALRSVNIDLFRSFFLERTEMIVFTTDSLPETFRFFDSAVARGKTLDPTDLLKAYHLCAMRDVTEERMAETAEVWESYSKEHLNRLFELWYPIRCWALHRPSLTFRDTEIHAFEGVPEGTEYPFARGLDRAPFSLTETIVDGKRFFSLVAYAYGLEKQLDELIDRYAPGLEERVRREFGDSDVGSVYCYSLFKGLLFLYLDRFAEADFEKALETCFIYSFALRLENQGIIWNDVNEYVLSQSSLFNTIDRAIDPYEVISYDFERNLSGMRNTRQKNGERNRLIEFDRDFSFLREAE